MNLRGLFGPHEQHEANLSQLGAATEKYHRRACREAHDGLSSTVDAKEFMCMSTGPTDGLSSTVVDQRGIAVHHIERHRWVALVLNM